ncbi:MAG: hypothetical protein JSR15_13465, partial [Proteobacteria bacterium]|nr:hypothetical protein [Pseudomonadota bacterium]
AAAGNQRPPPNATNARIDAAWDAQGRQIPLRHALTNGTTVELSRAAGSESPSIRKVVIYKGDMPDASRPDTCDNRLRDGDYVFVRSAPNATWLDSGAALWLAPDRAATVNSVGSTPPAADVLCFAGPRVCYSDRTGGAMCTWQPRCLDPPAS